MSFGFKLVLSKRIGGLNGLLVTTVIESDAGSDPFPTAEAANAKAWACAMEVCATGGYSVVSLSVRAR